MSVSVVVPTLNEEACLGKTLDSLEAQSCPIEVIVVDGGSSDRTREIAAGRARVIAADGGRAGQMNAGAKSAKADTLLFLHADTVLPVGSLRDIERSIGAGYSAGTFRLKFDDSSPLLRLSAFASRIRTVEFCFGDRGLFATTDTFHEAGGFPDIPLFEDIEMARRLACRGRFAFLETEVVTSARRFRVQGSLRQQWLNTRLWIRYQLGADPVSLAQFYPALIGHESLPSGTG